MPTLKDRHPFLDHGLRSTPCIGRCSTFPPIFFYQRISDLFCGDPEHGLDEGHDMLMGQTIFLKVFQALQMGQRQKLDSRRT